MKTTDMTRYIDSVATTARELEALGRRIGYYGRDCDTLDAALKKGRNGVVLIFDESGNVAETFALGDSRAKVAVEKGDNPNEWALTYSFPEWKSEGPTPKRVEEGGDPTKYTGNARMALDPYEQVAPGNFQRAAAQSHRIAEAAGETKTQKLTGDALRSKQIANSAKERIARVEGEKRSERIFAAMKAESDRQWKRSA